MANIRYEEHPIGEDSLPFTLYENLVRSATRRSENPNFHEEYEIEICHSGEGFALIDGVRYPFTAGDILVVHPGEIHYTGSEEALTYTALIFDGDLFDKLSIRRNAPLRFAHRIRSEEAARAFEQLLLIHRQKPPYYVAEAITALLSLILKLTPYIEEGTGEEPKGKNETVLRALEYIRQHHAERLTLDTIASALYQSKYTLCHIFRQYTGESIVTHIHRIRIGAAVQLLAQGHPVSEVAEAVGFENLSFFTKTFKRYMGKTPSAFQKEIHKKA